MLKWILLAGTHAGALAVGFALGIYLLPILTAPDSPDEAALTASAQSALYQASFTRELEGSDFLHWGEGTVSVTPQQIVHNGALSPGPDFKVYLTSEFVETEAAFEDRPTGIFRCWPKLLLDADELVVLCRAV